MIEIKIEDSEIVWLFQAGRSINFIAGRLKIGKRKVTSHLIVAGLIDKPKRRGYTSAPNFGTMHAATTVPSGDPLLTALRKHHPEKSEQPQCQPPTAPTNDGPKTNSTN